MDPVGIDVFENDLNGSPDWNGYVAAGRPWCFAILKATEGMGYAPTWFQTNWPAVRTAAGDRYGADFFRGCYHYWRNDQDGAQQADFFLDFVDKAGGWGSGDFAPIVDVENANNTGATSDSVISGVTAFADRCNERVGKRPILYGHSLLADLAITDHLGCDKLWVARYAATLPPETYQGIGWNLADLFGWQYCGTEGPTAPTGYPSSSPIGNADISALLLNGGGDGALRAASVMGAGLLTLLTPALAGIALGVALGRG